jgi:MFS family permease
MGIGRFAFTPVLPMMLSDRIIDLKGGSLLATLNLIGYLLGALACIALPSLLTRLDRLRPSSTAIIRYGLLATALLTLAMASPMPLLWPTLRFLAGVVTAITLIYTAGWCLARLARAGQASLGGIIFTGPGIGITLSGIVASALTAFNLSSSDAWLAFGALAAVMTALTWRIFQGDDSPLAPAVTVTAAPRGWTAEQLIFAVAYGLAGFGYIITATFMPVIAREALAASPWIDLFWPIFGVAIICGALLASLIPHHIDLRYVLIGSYIVQAAGILTSLIWPTITGFVFSSVLIGLPFTGITHFAMQEARRLSPRKATSFMALLTAVYGIGQIAGPPLVGLLLNHTPTHAAGFTLALQTAAVSLLVGALLYLFKIRSFPLVQTGGS